MKNITYINNIQILFALIIINSESIEQQMYLGAYIFNLEGNRKIFLVHSEFPKDDVMRVRVFLSSDQSHRDLFEQNENMISLRLF
jgi:hypothetical protein